jgi:hypothetical protein
MSYLLPAVVVVVVGCFLLSSQFFDGNPISFVSLTMSKKQKKKLSRLNCSLHVHSHVSFLSPTCGGIFQSFWEREKKTP